MTRFECKKFTETVLYILEKTGGIDYYHAFKILYFAERNHLAKWGSRMVPDEFCAFPYGPVPAQLYNALTQIPQPHDVLAKELSKVVFFAGGDAPNVLLPLRISDKGYLSESEIDALDKSIDENQNLTFNQLKEKSHDIAWEEAFNLASRRKPISPILIAIAGGATKEIISKIQRGLLQQSNQINIDLDSTKKQWFTRLKQLSQLPQNWDNEGAFPILKEITAFTYDLINALDPDILEKWWLVPAPNGTLGLIARKKIRASISIGINGFSCLAKTNDKDKMKGHGNLNLSDIKEKIEQITDRFLQ